MIFVLRNLSEKHIFKIFQLKWTKDSNIFFFPFLFKQSKNVRKNENENVTLKEKISISFDEEKNIILRSKNLNSDLIFLKAPPWTRHFYCFKLRQIVIQGAIHHLLSIVKNKGSQRVGHDPLLSLKFLLWFAENFAIDSSIIVILYMGCQIVYYSVLWVANYKTTGWEQWFSSGGTRTINRWYMAWWN